MRLTDLSWMESGVTDLSWMESGVWGRTKTISLRRVIAVAVFVLFTVLMLLLAVFAESRRVSHRPAQSGHFQLALKHVQITTAIRTSFAFLRSRGDGAGVCAKPASEHVVQ